MVGAFGIDEFDRCVGGQALGKPLGVATFDGPT